MHPRSKHWHPIDYIIVRQSHCQDVNLTRAMRGAECNTDHILIICKFSISIRPTTRRNPPLKKLNCGKFNEPETRNFFLSEITEVVSESQPKHINNLQELNQEWNHIKVTLQTCGKEVLRILSRKHKDWLDNNATYIYELLTKTKLMTSGSLIHLQLLEKLHFNVSRKKQKILRGMESNCWVKQAKQLQQAADKNDQHSFYNGLKTIFGPKQHNIAPIRTPDGDLLKEKRAIKDRWEQYFSTLLNYRNPVDPRILDQLPNTPADPHLELPSTFAETLKAIHSLKKINNK